VSRLQLRILVLVSAAVLSAVALGGVLAERQLREREMERLQVGLERQAALVRTFLEARGGPSLAESDRAAVDALADSAGRASRARVTLIGPDGAVLGDSEVPTRLLPEVESQAQRPEVQEARQGRTGRAHRLSRPLGRRFLYVAVPADALGGPGAVVRVAMPLDEVEAAVSGLRRRLLAAGALGLGGAVAVSFLVSWLSVRPLEELREVVEAIAEGRLDRRLRWTGRGGPAEISRAINRVAEQLRQRLDEATAEKEQLEAVLASMVEGVLVLEAGRIVLANPRARELLSAWGDLEGRRPLEVIRHAAIDDALEEARRGAAPVVRELEVRSGTPRTLLMTAVAFPPGEQASGTVAVFHDVTEIRRLEQVRRDFIANASHELRTPLTSIRGFADTLLTASLSKDEIRPYLETIVRNAERLGELIEDLLTLSRIESRKVPMQPGELDVTRVARTLASDVEPRLKEARLELRVDAPPDLPAAWADRRAVEQVISNLLDNAVKYTDSGGLIELELAAEPTRVRVRVRDSGIGIPEAEQTRIFERFYRVDKARSRALGGTGLGLSIVKHLVQAQGGDISVESEPGRGSCFSFGLPRADARVDSPSSSRPGETTPIP